MKLENVITVNLDKVRIADIDDFRVLTGKSLEQFRDEMLSGKRPIEYFDDMMDPEMRAFIWVFARDDDYRQRIWDDPDEMRRAMEADIRQLTIKDISDAAEKVREEAATAATPPAQARAQRATASQKRAAKRAEQAVG